MPKFVSNIPSMYDKELGRIKFPTENTTEEKAAEYREELKLKIKDAQGKLTKEDLKKVNEEKAEDTIIDYNELAEIENAALTMFDKSFDESIDKVLQDLNKPKKDERTSPKKD